VSAVRLAERQAAAHPRSVQAQLALGNAYLNAGETARADRAYRTAIRLSPRAPAPPTLHAMALGAEGRPKDALTQLRSVELLHPSYARAWLLDGLIASRMPGDRARARRAWMTFLRLQPHGAVSGNVRIWLKQLK
jgi:Flp pilus assembly protein TadD